MKHIEIGKNVVLSGRYRRAGRDSTQVTLLVHQPFLRDGRAYLVATNLANGAVQAYRADCFWPRSIALRAAEEAPLDLSNAFVAVGSGAFGFVDFVNAADVDFAHDMGAQPLSELTVDSVTLAYAE